MARSVIMPTTGMAMEEGTIVRWLKKPGETVTRGEPIAVIETDKATMDLEAEDEGTLLAVVHGEGTVVKATHTIAWIGAPGESIDPAAGRAAATDDSTTRPDAASPAAGLVPAGVPALGVLGERIPATPAARRIARELDVVLAGVKGTGPGGAVRARDVTAAGAAAARAAPLAHGVDRAAGEGAANGGRRGRAGVEVLAAESVMPISSMRRAIAEKMLKSHQSVPSVTLVSRADVTELIDLRGRVNAGGGPKISFTDLVVWAAAAALRENPLLNSVIDGERVVFRDEVNVGVAVAREAGLIVPVIHGADRLSVRQISERLRDLSERARAGTLAQADCEGGTFTVTNLGMYGITEFTPLINIPESAILGVGAIEEVLRRAGDGTIGSRQLVNLCLTHDHRHIDGVPAAVFLGRVRALLENCRALLA
jgi:pyruvate dehydrogenase E2 component (dihydrolipoamide acetyltransferase)